MIQISAADHYEELLGKDQASIVDFAKFMWNTRVVNYANENFL